MFSPANSHCCGSLRSSPEASKPRYKCSLQNFVLYVSASLTCVSPRDKITSALWITGFKRSFSTNACHSGLLMRWSALLRVLILLRVSASCWHIASVKRRFVLWLSCLHYYFPVSESPSILAEGPFFLTL